MQDDWKLSSKLALNLGVRYDFITPALEAENRQANFDPSTGTHGPGHGRLAGGPRPGEPGQEQLRARAWGIVYKVDDKTVLRGGYGIFYNMFDRIGSEDQIALNPGSGLVSLQPATATVATGPLFLLRNGFPAGYLDPARIDLSARGHPRRRRELAQGLHSTSSAWARSGPSPTSGWSRSTSSAPKAATSPT